MKILFTLFVLLFSSSVLSDDISDFQIEGISIGSNLLDYYTKEEIKDHFRKNAYTHIEENNKFYHTEFVGDSFKEYVVIQISYKIRNDNFYEISMIAGGIFCADDINACYQKQDEIINDLSNIFKDFPKNKKTYNSENGKFTEINHKISSGIIRIQVVEWNKEITWINNVRVILMADEFHDWLG